MNRFHNLIARRKSLDPIATLEVTAGGVFGSVLCLVTNCIRNVCYLSPISSTPFLATLIDGLDSRQLQGDDLSEMAKTQTETQLADQQPVVQNSEQHRKEPSQQQQ
jgi:hypothetical protein